MHIHICVISTLNFEHHIGNCNKIKENLFFL